MLSGSTSAAIISGTRYGTTPRWRGTVRMMDLMQKTGIIFVHRLQGLAARLWFSPYPPGLESAVKISEQSGHARAR
jgi:hypothetical protein